MSTWGNGSSGWTGVGFGATTTLGTAHSGSEYNRTSGPVTKREPIEKSWGGFGKPEPKRVDTNGVSALTAQFRATGFGRGGSRKKNRKNRRKSRKGSKSRKA